MAGSWSSKAANAAGAVTNGIELDEKAMGVPCSCYTKNGSDWYDKWLGARNTFHVELRGCYQNDKTSQC